MDGWMKPGDFFSFLAYFLLTVYVSILKVNSFIFL